MIAAWICSKSVLMFCVSSNCKVMAGRTQRTHRGHLADAGNERKLALERRGDVRGHGFGARPRKKGTDLNGRKVNVGQCRHRQVQIANNSHQQEPIAISVVATGR